MNMFCFIFYMIFDMLSRVSIFVSDGAKVCFIRLFTRKFSWNSPKDLQNTFPYQGLVYISDRLRELKQQNFVDSSQFL